MAGGKTAKIVPWATWAEWRYVRDGLRHYSPGKRGTEEPARDALRIVQVWRCRGSVPMVADTHASLVQAMLLLYAGGSALPELVFRQAVSMTIVRFVNGLCDAQRGGAYARSVAQVARQLGLPSLSIDVRHDATHGHLPAVELLLRVTSEVIAWGCEKYWVPQSEAIAEVGDGDATADPKKKKSGKGEGEEEEEEEEEGYNSYNDDDDSDGDGNNNNNNDNDNDMVTDEAGFVVSAESVRDRFPSVNVGGRPIGDAGKRPAAGGISGDVPLLGPFVLDTDGFAPRAEFVGYESDPEEDRVTGDTGGSNVQSPASAAQTSAPPAKRAKIELF